MTDKEDKTVRQFVLFCRTALMYEKKNYYNEQKHRAEREAHIEMLSLKQSGMIEKKLIHTMLIIFQSWDTKLA